MGSYIHFSTVTITYFLPPFCGLETSLGFIFLFTANDGFLGDISFNNKVVIASLLLTLLFVFYYYVVKA